MDAQASQDPHTTHAERVIREEREHIDRSSGPLWGLAHSGGGIRSASFSLGVLQALDRKWDGQRYFERLDYLSTVSGGGYSGGSLTWFLQQGFPGHQGDEPDEGTFPFGQSGQGARVEGSRNIVLDFIRQHARYLTPGRGLTAISLVGVALRGLFVSLLVYGSVMVLCWVGARGLGLTEPRSWLAGWPATPDLALDLAATLTALIVVAAVLFSIRTALRTPRVLDAYRWSVWDQRWVGLGWTVVLVFLVVGSVPWLYGMIRGAAVPTAGSSLGLGSLLGLFQYRSEQTRTDARSGWMASARIYGAVALLLYGLLFLTFALSHRVFVSGQAALIVAGLVAGVLVVGGLVNMNHAGLHRMYRDRLMETFMPDEANVVSGDWGLATAADRASLDEMCTEVRRPYHLINANVVLVDSSKPRFHGRGGDSFLLSPLYCGSDATGWRKTEHYNKGGGNRGMTLPTAVAISGAAVNPNAGVAGGGVTRSRLVSVLMTLLNLRLGYWAMNPKKDRKPRGAPNYLWPGIWWGLLGKGHDENAGTVELTDGGHFENLALYELIRRRVDVIIACDAGADPDFQFADLANALERTRVDFGVTIRFRPGLGPEGLVPGSAINPDPLIPGEVAARGYAVADIWYDGGGDKAHGTLIYLKTTLTEGLPADIYGYKKAHDTFPDQSTADQFFDEAQFEAYRELGYQLAKAMIRAGVLEASSLAEPPTPTASGT